MIVRVRLFSGLNKYIPGLSFAEPYTLALPADAVLETAVIKLGLPRDRHLSCFINGLVRDLNYPLQDGDEISIFPPVGGG